MALPERTTARFRHHAAAGRRQTWCASMCSSTTRPEFALFARGSIGILILELVEATVVDYAAPRDAEPNGTITTDQGTSAPWS